VHGHAPDVTNSGCSLHSLANLQLQVGTVANSSTPLPVAERHAARPRPRRSSPNPQARHPPSTGGDERPRCLRVSSAAELAPGPSCGSQVRTHSSKRNTRGAFKPAAGWLARPCQRQLRPRPAAVAGRLRWPPLAARFPLLRAVPSDPIAVHAAGGGPAPSRVRVRRPSTGTRNPRLAPVRSGQRRTGARGERGVREDETSCRFPSTDVMRRALPVARARRRPGAR
jgi:hypothetical protein